MRALWQMISNLGSKKVQNTCCSGTKAEVMVHYIKPVQNRSTYIHILHVDTNDLRSESTPKEITQ